MEADELSPTATQGERGIDRERACDEDTTHACDAPAQEQAGALNDGGASPPLGGTKSGDMWSPVSDRDNQWVQVGVWGGDPATTCLGHHEIAGGIHGDPAWGQDG